MICCNDLEDSMGGESPVFHRYEETQLIFIFEIWKNRLTKRILSYCPFCGKTIRPSKTSSIDNKQAIAINNVIANVSCLSELYQKIGPPARVVHYARDRKSLHVYLNFVGQMSLNAIESPDGKLSFFMSE